MRFPSISDRRNSSFGGAEKDKEKESSHVDRIEDAAAGQDVANTEARDEEAWRGRERRIVRKLDVTLLPTVWTLYLFKFVDGFESTRVYHADM